MATLTVRKLRDDVHQALKVRAAQNGRSAEAEARQILQAAVFPSVSKLKLGSLLVSIAAEAGTLDADESGIFESVRDKSVATSLDFE